MGGAQPLAATFAGACCSIECQQSRIEFRLKPVISTSRRPTSMTLARIARLPPKGEAIGFLGNAAEILPELVRRAAGIIKPDIVTDQTSAHDLVNGYLPAGWTLALEWQNARADNARHAALRDAAAPPAGARRRCSTSLRGHPKCVDYGNNIRQVARDRGVKMRSPSRFCARYIRLSSVAGPVPLGGAVGDPDDIAKTDAKVKSCSPKTNICIAGSTWRKRIAFQGLPARICWIGLGERHRRDLRSTRWSRAVN